MNDESRVIDVNLPVTALDVTGDTTRRRLPRGYLASKRVFDIALALGAMPILIVISIVLVFANPLWNRGPLFYSQLRMGRRCKPFMAYKFRTMTSAPDVARGPNDPLETDRITRLGYLLRRLRLDEMPQFVNVLLGEMSVIGPRPDYWDHAVHYSETVPGYRQRHAMRPGITGLAQVDNGYAEGTDATFVKTRHDMRYINSASLATDWYILRKTVVVIFTGFGAR